MSTCCAQSTENQHIVAVTGKDVPKWSGKKMERDEGLNTVECLRGRLLAERQASRLAKEEAESMGNKLVELEKKLGDEIKLTEKAEKKLQRLKKKLESLNISSSSEGSEQSCSSEKCESSCRSPASASSSASSDSVNPVMSENAKHNVSDPPGNIAKDYDSQYNINSTSDSNSGYTSPQNLLENSNPNPNSQALKNDESRFSSSSSKDCNFQDLKNDESRLSPLSSKALVTEDEDEDRDANDNSLALVPVNFPTKTESRTSKPVNESVIEALNALRHAREKLLCSMVTRQMIQVGPT